jgi:O-antigen/teichoic acid export membrane protein
MPGTPTTLTQKATSGVAWSSVFQVCRQLLSLVSVSVLTHKIPPSAYGLVAMAAVLIALFETLRDLGTNKAIIREPVLSDRLVSSVFWINAGFGALESVCIFGLATPAALFFHEPRLTGVVRALSGYFLISSFSLIPEALLTRQLAFRRLNAAQYSGAVVGTVAAIVAAFSGGGVWSLVLGQLTGAAATGLALWSLCPHRLRLVIDLEEVRSIASFSLNLSAFAIVNYLSRNVDNLIIGKFLGSTPLGIYQVAYTVMTYPLNNFSQMIGSVLFPAMSQLKDANERIRSAFVRACSLIGLFTFPAMLGLMITAKPFVIVIMGNRWLPVVGLLKVFAPLGMAQSIFTLVGLIYYVKGRTDWMFRWGIVTATLTVASFFVGLRWGIQGVANAYAITWTLLMVPGLAIPFRLINLSLTEFFHHLWPGLRISLVMAAVAAGWLHGMQRLKVSSAPLELFSTVAVGAVCYVLLILWWKPPVLSELRSLLNYRNAPPI